MGAGILNVIALFSSTIVSRLETDKRLSLSVDRDSMHFNLHF